MSKIRILQMALLIMGMSITLAAQDNTQSQPQAPPPDTTPAPAFGQNAPILSPENPPVTGLDQPGLDLHPSSRSFISPAIEVSESADTNGANQLDYKGLNSVSRVVGAFDLQQFWPKSDLFLEYLGGGAFYTQPYYVRQLQAMGFLFVTRWRTGQLAVRDAFEYLPDGSFEIGTFGGSPGLGIANSGGIGIEGGGLPGAHLFGGGSFGAVGNYSRLANTAIVDVVQAISPVAALTVAGGFSNAHFFDPTDQLINSDQLTIEGGYSHLLGRYDQIGAIYAFQLIQFPQVTGGQIYAHIMNIRYSHAISGRLRLVAGAGPEYLELEEGGYSSRWALSARVQLHYKMGKGELIASYEKFTSAGSGLFAGSNVQAARLGYTRPLGRTWQFYGDLGYSHNTRIQSTPETLGIGAGSYNDGFASAIFRKHIGRTWEFLAAYRFGEEEFDEPITLFGSTGRISQRQIGGIGLLWHPRPTRIE